MLSTHQSVSALFIAAWCGVVLSLAGSQPVAAVSAPAPIQPITAAVLPVEAPVDLSAVPLAAPEPVLVHPDAPPALVVVPSRASRYISIDTFMAEAEAVGWQPSTRLVAVATCESGADLDHDGVKEVLDMAAVSPQGDSGPLQINPVHGLPGGLVQRLGYVWADMLSLIPNLTVGLAIYEAAGDDFTPWTCNP